MDPVYQKITTVLGEKFGVDPNEIRPDSTLEDLDLDSITAVEFVDVLKEDLSFTIDDMSLKGKTLRDITDAVKERLQES